MTLPLAANAIGPLAAWSAVSVVAAIIIGRLARQAGPDIADEASAYLRRLAPRRHRHLAPVAVPFGLVVAPVIGAQAGWPQAVIDSRLGRLASELAALPEEPTISTPDVIIERDPEAPVHHRDARPGLARRVTAPLTSGVLAQIDDVDHAVLEPADKPSPTATDTSSTTTTSTTTSTTTTSTPAPGTSADKPSGTSADGSAGTSGPGR